ncbi:MAG TPA: PKD domain-containing protein, partial [Thermoanaerobaculia bacterium]
MHRMIAALAATAVFFAAACDEHAPVLPTEPGPPGVANVTIALTSDRVSLDAGSTSPAKITITALLSDNRPVPDNSEIAVNTTLGYFALDPDSKPVQLISVKTIGGAATVQFFAGSQPGTANLLAQMGTSVGKLNVAIGIAPVPPVADFAFEKDGLRVLFTDLSTGPPATRKWSFGDDSADSTDANPAHEYAIAGTYAVTLAVTNSGGSSTKSKFVTLGDPPPLVASFTSQGDGLKVVFTDTSAGNPTLWTWDFGDNKSSTERNPQHTYASPGTYLVTLRIGGGGRSGSTSVFVDVGGAPPAADFTFDISGQRVIFTDTSTGTPTSWRWDFGDQSDIALTQSAVHTYSKPDIYTVTLTAANAGGMNSKTQFVPVTLGDKPVPSFKADVSGLDVVFTDTSTGTPTAWEWTFGDDSGVDTRQNPAHHYNAAKTYTVTLKATNPAGSASINQFVKTLATPSAAFAYSLSSQDTLTASFVDLSTGSPTAWQWNFGDCADQPGCTSTMQNPV